MARKGKIRIIRDSEADWEQVRPEWAAKYGDGDAGLRFKRLLPADVAQMPNMQRSQYHPNHVEPPHSHPEDEILYILSGEVLMGARSLGAGDAIYVSRDTVYSLRTGETGAEFLRVGFGDLSAK